MTWKQPKTTLTDLLLHNSDHMLDLKINFIKFNENLNIFYFLHWKRLYIFTFYHRELKSSTANVGPIDDEWSMRITPQNILPKLTTSRITEKALKPHISVYTGSLRIAKPQIWRPSLRIPIHVQPQKEAEHRTKQQCLVKNFSHE